MDQITSTAVTEQGKVAFQIRQKYLPNIFQIRVLHPFKGAVIPYLHTTSVKSISYIFTYPYTIICTVCVLSALYSFQSKGFSKISSPIKYLKFNSAVLCFARNLLGQVGRKQVILGRVVKIFKFSHSCSSSFHHSCMQKSENGQMKYAVVRIYGVYRQCEWMK